MKIHFVGGPWDGVEFETSYFPDQIGFRKLEVEIEDHGGMEMTISTDKREHHQYLLQVRVVEDRAKIYEYAPGKKLWWEE